MHARTHAHCSSLNQLSRFRAPVFLLVVVCAPARARLPPCCPPWLHHPSNWHRARRTGAVEQQAHNVDIDQGSWSNCFTSRRSNLGLVQGVWVIPDRPGSALVSALTNRREQLHYWNRICAPRSLPVVKQRQQLQRGDTPFADRVNMLANVINERQPLTW